MNASTTKPRKKDAQDEAPAKLKIDQCPVCLTKDANTRLYVSGDALKGNRPVWLCAGENCGHEWPRSYFERP